MTLFVAAVGVSELQFACGVEFNTRIGVAVTTTMADTATTLATSSSVLLMVAYR